MNNVSVLTSLLVCSLALGGCDSFRNTFGLDHYRPQEWDTTAPNEGLILPPDYALRPKLPPPRPGAPNPHAVPDTVKAKKTVLGDAPPADDAPASTKGEADVVEKASEQQPVTPNIRKIVDEEAKKEESVSEKVISKIKDWKDEAKGNLTLSNVKDKRANDKEATPEDTEQPPKLEEETPK